jgi:hypothetical protein
MRAKPDLRPGDELPGARTDEIQLTRGPYNHFLSPFGPFSPDDEWLVYDRRTDETAMGSNPFIEKVNTRTGRIVVLYEVPGQTPFGPGCGTPSYSPTANQTVFIHGIMNADERRPYAMSRRTGVMVKDDAPGKGIFIDARDVTPPFTAGALRGGTHAHEWSGDGRWIGFTYNDAILAEIEKRTGNAVDLRTVGVSADLRPVTVDKDADGENNDGLWYSVLVAQVTAEPDPGSDQISRAFENAWVGKHGYRKPDGSVQRAQAYLGTLRTRDGGTLVEMFISDIPDRIDRPGADGPLEGTIDDFPMPPAGVTQRRLTHTEGRAFPGIVTRPRHWVVSSADGRFIGCLAKDDAGVVQLFTVSPVDGAMRQATFHAGDIQSTLSWHSRAYKVAYVCDNSIFVTELDQDGAPLRHTRLTARTEDTPLCPCYSRNGTMIAYNRIVPTGGDARHQIFLITPAP